jgi:hypothetical protein
MYYFSGNDFKFVDSINDLPDNFDGRFYPGPSIEREHFHLSLLGRFIFSGQLVDWVCPIDHYVVVEGQGGYVVDSNDILDTRGPNDFSLSASSDIPVLIVRRECSCWRCGSLDVLELAEKYGIKHDYLYVQEITNKMTTYRINLSLFRGDPVPTASIVCVDDPELYYYSFEDRWYCLERDPDYQRRRVVYPKEVRSTGKVVDIGFLKGVLVRVEFYEGVFVFVLVPESTDLNLYLSDFFCNLPHFLFRTVSAIEDDDSFHSNVPFRALDACHSGNGYECDMMRTYTLFCSITGESFDSPVFSSLKHYTTQSGSDPKYLSNVSKNKRHVVLPCPCCAKSFNKKTIVNEPDFIEERDNFLSDGVSYGPYSEDDNTRFFDTEITKRSYGFRFIRYYSKSDFCRVLRVNRPVHGCSCVTIGYPCAKPCCFLNSGFCFVLDSSVFLPSCNIFTLLKKGVKYSLIVDPQELSWSKALMSYRLHLKERSITGDYDCSQAFGEVKDELVRDIRLIMDDFHFEIVPKLAKFIVNINTGLTAFDACLKLAGSHIADWTSKFLRIVNGYVWGTPLSHLIVSIYHGKVSSYRQGIVTDTDAFDAVKSLRHFFSLVYCYADFSCPLTDLDAVLLASSSIARAGDSIDNG